jgi:hypothetical protein
MEQPEAGNYHRNPTADKAPNRHFNPGLIMWTLFIRLVYGQSCKKYLADLA